MAKVKFLRLEPFNDEQIGRHLLIEKDINPHCVLVLIGYRINLLLFVSTSKIVPLLPIE